MDPSDAYVPSTRAGSTRSHAQAPPSQASSNSMDIDPALSTGSRSQGKRRAQVLDEEVEEEDEQEQAEAPAEARLPRKEMEREKKDLELGELLEMMEDWKPIVRYYYTLTAAFDSIVVLDSRPARGLEAL